MGPHRRRRRRRFRTGRPPARVYSAEEPYTVPNLPRSPRKPPLRAGSRSSPAWFAGASLCDQFFIENGFQPLLLRRAPLAQPPRPSRILRSASSLQLPFLEDRQVPAQCGGFFLKILQFLGLPSPAVQRFIGFGNFLLLAPGLFFGAVEVFFGVLQPGAGLFLVRPGAIQFRVMLEAGLDFRQPSLVGIDLTIQDLQSEKVGNARHGLNYRANRGQVNTRRVWIDLTFSGRYNPNGFPFGGKA